MNVETEVREAVRLETAERMFRTQEDVVGTARNYENKRGKERKDGCGFIKVEALKL